MAENHTSLMKLGGLLKARFPFIYIPTWEEERAVQMVLSVAHDPNIIKTVRKVFTWTQTNGWIDENGAQTVFTDIVLLQKTLVEHGLAVSVVSDDHLVCVIGDVRLDYSRQAAAEPFMVTVSGLRDVDGFLAEMDCFEREYKQNVQSYTYNKLIENLNETTMNVSEEAVLEDNSILLTIDI